MKKRVAGLFVTAGMVFCALLVGCQSGNQDTEIGDDVKKDEVSLPAGTSVSLTAPQQDALDAFNRGDKKLLGVQTR